MEFIPDDAIRDADPEAVIQQYRPLVCKLAQKYTDLLSRTGAIDEDDLHQVGFMAILDAQKRYNPARGISFLTFLYNPIRRAMRDAIGFNNNTGKPPEELIYLDASIQDADGITLSDTIPDDHPTREDELVEQAARDEVSEAVRDAVARMKNQRFREVITRIWFDGQDKQTAADEMGIAVSALRNYDLKGRYKLRRDKQLKSLVFPLFYVGVNTFNTTMTSAVEKAILWREQRVDSIFGGGFYSGSRENTNSDE